MSISGLRTTLLAAVLNDLSITHWMRADDRIFQPAERLKYGFYFTKRSFETF